MLAWVNMLMLTGLAALAIPIAIHLLRNRKFESADIGSLRFLRQAVRETARWRRLRDLLLLLLRLLAIALLTLLFARPYWTRKGAVPDRDLESVLLLDASGSMAGRLQGRPIWRTVLDDAAEVQSRLPESALSVTGVFADRVATPPTLPDKPARGATTDYAGALRWAADRLRSSKTAQREVILITDLQRRTLPEFPLADWPADIPVRIRPIPTAGAYNLAIGGITCLTPAPENEARFAVHLVASGTCPLDTVEVTFHIEGQAPQKQQVPAETRDLVFTWDKPVHGICRLQAAVASSDAWPDDDELRSACELRLPLPIMLVDPSRPKLAQDRESYFLATALSSERDGTGRALYRVTTRPAPDNPAAAALVALCDAPALRDDQANALADAVKKGTGLMIFLGDAADDAALQALQRAGLLPGEIERTKVPIPMTFGEWDATHPAMRLFASPETGNLRRIVFRDAFRVKPHPEIRVLARLTNGNPAILAEKLGQGRVIWITNPCSRAWTDWPAERIFLPLMRELAAYAARLDDRWGKVDVRTASVSDTRAPGVYDGENGKVTVIQPVTDETRIERCTEEEFRLALGIGPAPAISLAEAASGLPPNRERRHELWRWLALALALVLFIESITADWPRRRQNSAG